MLGKPRRLALLAEGSFVRLDAKTAIGVLRYRPQEVAAVIDSTRAGRTAETCVGVGGRIPVVASLDEAAARGADSLLIGIAPQGGGLPDAWRSVVRDALLRGWDVISGLHVFFGDDPEFRAAAERSGAVIHDLRRPPAERVVAAGRAGSVDALVVTTVGTDCNVGKMTTSLELVKALAEQGLKAAFVATGQTGIALADEGIAVDAVPADFVAGAVERLVVRAARGADVVVVEGQGGIHHPGYSGLTLSLMHGAMGEAMVLCHEAGRDSIRHSASRHEDVPIASLDRVCDDYERAASWRRDAPVVAVSLNTSGIDEGAARRACEEAARVTRRPATDPVRFGCGPIADVVRSMAARRARATSA
jgi:uncharacterized NAD-dependent epimerase/dehydratase family protein